MKTGFKKFAAIIMCAIMCISLLVAPVAAASVDKSTEAMYYSVKIKSLAKIITEYGLYSSIDDDPILEALGYYFAEHPEEFNNFANIMFGVQDRYSYYLSADEYDTYFAASDSFVGIGIRFESGFTAGNHIAEIIEGSPADNAGLQAGDIIMKVDGQDVTWMTTAEIQSCINGEAGSGVDITYFRPDTNQIHSKRIVRSEISVSNISYKPLGDIAYIAISRFGDIQTAIDFKTVYDEIKLKGVESVIIDIRSNPGGSIAALLEIMNMMIPEADVEMVSIKDRSGENTSYITDGTGWLPEKLVMLVDGASASASEIFAGTMQDYGYATVIGTQTYGKGVGQYHLEMGDGAEAVLTGFELYLPKQGSYDGVGITPDEKVELGYARVKLPDLGKLTISRGMKVGDVSEEVLGLENRLALLGYFYGAPDNVFDGETLEAVNRFQRAFDLPVVSTASTNMINNLIKQVSEYSKGLVVIDTQLERAIELLSE